MTGPPHNSLGRPNVELLSIYKAEVSNLLHRHRVIFVCDSVYMSQFSKLNLREYMLARKQYCAQKHLQPCLDCSNFLSVAEVIVKEGSCILKDAYELVSPFVKYTTERARRMLFQMPLVSIRIGRPVVGLSYTLLLERCLGVDYSKVSLVMNRLSLSKSPSQVMDKTVAKDILSLAQSERERACLRYAIVKAAGISTSQARRQYRFTDNSSKVQQSIEEIREIREAVDDLAATQDKTLLLCHGISPKDSTEESCSDSGPEEVVSVVDARVTHCLQMLCPTLKDSLARSTYNL